MTEAQKVAYEGQGYLVMDGVLDPGELDRVRAAFDRAQEGGGLDDLPNRDDVFIHLAEHPALFPAVHRSVGDDVQVRSLHGIRSMPGGAGRGWRREVAGILRVHHPASTLCVQAVFHLDDAQEADGCIAVVPGSHRYEMGHPLPDIQEHGEMPHHVKMVVQAGDAVLMNGYTWHARFHNRSDRPRKVLE